ncbi:unnamed protein product [Schistosoma curassoni]|uniref:Mut7-C domain-containing protein n=1 Tax=Schistosoma curassoni TaxID=6186 RepID=A0A183JHG5_9TREM|nr:unnamed protein product [Schistosoma curassoni]
MKVVKCYVFYDECINRNGNANSWHDFCKVFDLFTIAALVREKVLWVHGGKSQNPGGPSEGSGSLNSANVNHHSIGSKERLGGAGGGGSGNGTGSFIRCNKCGGPLKSLDPKASYISRFMECEACEQLYELTDKSDLSSFSNVDESRHLSLVSPKEASHSLCKYVVFLIPCLLF